MWQSTKRANEITQKFTLGLSLTALDLAHIAQSAYMQLNVCLQQNAIRLDSEAVGKRNISATPIKVYLRLDPTPPPPLHPLPNALRACFKEGVSEVFKAFMFMPGSICNLISWNARPLNRENMRRLIKEEYPWKTLLDKRLV